MIVSEKPRDFEKSIALASTCVRALARVQLGMIVPDSSARELVRVYGDIRQVMNRLRLIREKDRGPWTQSISDQQGIAEASILGPSPTRTTIKAVVELRGAEWTKTQSRIAAQNIAQSTKYGIDSLGQDIRGWGKDYEHFIHSIGSLFTRTQERIHVLGLREQDREKALVELQEILASAITRCHSEAIGD